MRTLATILLICIAAVAGAQVCSCPAGVNNDNDDAPYRTFRFSNGKELGICGYYKTEVNDTLYSKFALYECGAEKPFKEWSVDKSSTLQKIKDTLLVKDMYSLPIGQSFSNLWRPFFIHKFFYKNGTLTETTSFQKGLSKYSKAQTEQVFKEYGELTKDSKHAIIRVASMLFWASYCGTEDAEELLKGIPEKFGPFDEVQNAELEGIFDIYKLWKEHSK